MTNAYSCDSKRSYMRYSSKKVQCYLISQNEKGKDKKSPKHRKTFGTFLLWYCYESIVTITRQQELPPLQEVQLQQEPQLLQEPQRERSLERH